MFLPFVHELYLIFYRAQEKPKEKTIFSVKLESFEATAKPKIIREVKALIPNLNLIDVCNILASCACFNAYTQ